MDLAACAAGTTTDKGAHGYLLLYERHLDPSRIGTLLEIGVHRGGSLLMWHRWMPHAEIIGIDNDPSRIWEHDGLGDLHGGVPNVEVIEADACGYTFGARRFDVVIDDGSHDGNEQTRCFDLHWPSVAPGGWYVIEDLETVWRDEWPGGGAAWALLSQLLRATLLGRTPTAPAAAPGAPEVAELHAYEQIVFARKRSD